MQAPILVLGRYEIGDLIATGGMAAVYRARIAGPMGFEKPVAVKILLEDAAQDEEVVRMFIDEARLGARLSHPNIASVLDFGEADGRFYLAMEYVDWFSLSSMLRRLRHRALDPKATIYVAQSVLRALAYAHALKDEHGRPLGVVHRDVSPQNILLDRSGMVKLCDFGIATGAHRNDRTQAGLIKGKTAFMSPEQAAGERLDARSDLYSLAMTVVAMLGGAPGPDDGARSCGGVLESGRSDALQCPDALKSVLKKALSRKPADRFQTAVEFSKALSATGLDHGEAGRLALVEAVQKVPVPKPKSQKVPRREPDRRTAAPARSDVGYKSLLLLVLGVVVVALILALLGVRLPQGEDRILAGDADALTSTASDP